MGKAIAGQSAQPSRLRRTGVLGRRKICAECSGTGSVWIICPDAGACKVQCTCTQTRERSAGSIVVDLAMASAFVSGCGILFFSL